MSPFPLCAEGGCKVSHTWPKSLMPRGAFQMVEGGVEVVLLPPVGKVQPQHDILSAEVRELVAIQES